MRVAASYQYPTMESVIYGKPAADALREEAERLGARRVYLIVSRTLNTKTDEIEKIRKALGDRYAETFDGIPQHTTREVVVRTAEQARDAKADLVVFGMGERHLEVALAKLVGANKRYIEETIPHISSLMVSSPREVIEVSDVVVVGKKNPQIHEAIIKYKDSKLLIDLVRLQPEVPDNSPNYDGICW